MTITSGPKALGRPRLRRWRGGRLARALLAACLVAILARAAPSLAPAPAQAQGPTGGRFTNVTDVAFTVSWLSATAETGHVLYGASPSTVTSRADDDRGPGTSGATHHVTVTGLTAQTAYFVDYYTGASVNNNGGAHYRVVTGPAAAPGQPSAVYGLTARASGAPPAGILVYLTLTDGDGKGSPGGAHAMSCIVKPGDQGYWVMNLGNARLGDLSGSFVYSPSGDRLMLALMGGIGETLEATLDTSAAAPASLLTVPAAAPTVTATPQPPPPTSTPRASATPTRSPAPPTASPVPPTAPSSPTAALATPAAATPTPSRAAATATASPAPPAAPSPTIAATASATPATPAATAAPDAWPTTTPQPPPPTASATLEATPPAAVATRAPTARATPGAASEGPDPLALAGGALVAVAVIGLGAVGILMRRQRG